MEEPGSDAHQDMIGDISSGNNNEGGGDIQDITYTVKNFFLVTAKCVQPSFSLVSWTAEPEGTSPISEQNYHRATIFLMIFILSLGLSVRPSVGIGVILNVGIGMVRGV